MNSAVPRVAAEERPPHARRGSRAQEAGAGGEAQAARPGLLL